MIRHIHITNAADFEATKFAYNSDNSMYFTGSSSTIAIGTPDVNYEDIVFIKSASCIYTHGKLYPCSNISTLESLSHEQNTDNKIVDDTTTPHTSVKTTATSIEAYGSLHAGRYGLADSNGVNAFQVGNGIDSQNKSNIHSLSWNGTSWTKQDVSCGGTAAAPTKLLSRSMQMGADPMSEAQLQTLISNSGLIPGCYYATIEE